MTELSDVEKLSARRKGVPSGLVLAERIREGATTAGLAAEYEVSKSTVARAVNDAGLSSADGCSTVQLRPENARVPIVSFEYTGHWDIFESAACVGEDPELWFPQTARQRDIREPLAKAICEGCDARVACLEQTLEEEKGYAGRYGIRGGLNEDERARLAESGAA